MTCGYEDSFEHLLLRLSVLCGVGDQQSAILVFLNFLCLAMPKEASTFWGHVVCHQLSHSL